MAYFFVLILLAIAHGDAPKHAVQVRLNHPELQLDGLIQLFEGERVRDPASALAAWKRADGRAQGQSKAVEAAIATLNPAMVRELKSLDMGEFVLDFGPERGEPHWFLRLVNDDGTIGALATALVLSGGENEPQMDDIDIDRLGPVGSPLLAKQRDDRRHAHRWEPLVIASHREDIAAAFAGMPIFARNKWSREQNIVARISPAMLAKSRSIAVRHGAELLLGLGIRHGDIRLKLHSASQRSTAHLSLIAYHRSEGTNFPAKIDPAWLDSVPGSASVAFAFALDPKPEMWDALFAALDRSLQANPANAKAASIRVRLNLLATAAGVKPEVDLWPKLVGVSGFARLEPKGPARLETGLISFHLADETAARAIAAEFIPKVARFARLGPAEGGEIRTLGRVSGKSLLVTRQGSSVWIGWGERSIASALDAAVKPENSARRAVLSPHSIAIAEQQASRLVAVWPGRWGDAVAGLEDAPPVVWHGITLPGGFQDYVTWPDVKKTLHAYLERLPMKPRN